MRISKPRPPALLVLISTSLFLLAPDPASAAESNQPMSKLVSARSDGRLEYTPWSEAGDVIPDFSWCGYRGGGVALPAIPERVTLEPASDGADDTARVQAAIDRVSALSADANGFRGAVRLKRGEYRISGALTIRTSGVVLRGEGSGDDGTILRATGKSRRILININGTGAARAVPGTRQTITSEVVPVGARSFLVENGSGLKAGDAIIVARNGNREWIHEIGMDAISPRPGNPSSTRQWGPFTMEFERTVVAVEGNKVFIDAPIVCAIEARWGGGAVWKYDDAGRVSNAGVENLRAVSDFDPAVKARRGDQEYFADEDHAQYLVRFGNARDCWASHLTALHFYHGVSTIDRGAKWVTVTDCSSLEPVSQLTGGRRYPFNINGQLSLVQRCYSDGARHAFVLGSRVAGPNVFLDCRSKRDYGSSEPHHRWSVGGLFDNVEGQIAIQDRGHMGSGHGWSGANYVAWNCKGTLICQKPPTAQNFAIGFIGQRGGGAFEREAGWWESHGTHVSPRSLYLKQLEDRLGPDAVRAVK